MEKIQHKAIISLEFEDLTTRTTQRGRNARGKIITNSRQIDIALSTKISMSELEGFNQHLEELRKRLLRIVLVIGIITVFLLTFHAEPIQVGQFTLYYPTPEPLNNIAAQITTHMKENLVPEDVQFNSDSSRASILCTSVHCSTSRNYSWNANNHQRVSRIHQTSIKRK